MCEERTGARRGSSRKSGCDSAEKKESVTPSSDSPTRYAFFSGVKDLGRGTHLKDIPKGKLQFVNLQYKKVWWEVGKRYVKLRLSSKALKTIEKNGLDDVAKKVGTDLRKE
ncbi:Ribosomal L28 family [Gossypium australe]|uniref:Ribosomal L28 family n=1 Tax=Gossypium australe TaxID=47621 RepID=A0A5B6W6K5_9ROSI|nr:Ribosomal L28 family [Gossypium australe]